MKRRGFLAGAVGGLGAAGASPLAAPAIAQDRTEWRMVTPWPRNTPGVGVNAQRFADRVTAMTDGRLTVTLHAAGELVPPFEVLDAVMTDTADMAHATPYYWVGKSPALNYFTTIPFGLTATELAAWLYFGGGMELWREAYDAFDDAPFYAGSSGVQAGGWFNKEINSVDDLNGLKFRIAGLGGEVMRRLGATVVLTPPSEVFAAMASGAVDAAELIGPWSDQAFGLYRVAQYYYVPAFHEVGPTAELLINRAAWESLPADLQAVVEEAAMASAMQYHADYAYHDVHALQALVEEHGVELRTFPDEVVEALGRVTLEVLEDLGNRNELTRRIHESYMDFLLKANPYSQWFDRRLLEMRAIALGQEGKD